MKKSQKKVVCVRLSDKTINEIKEVCNDLKIEVSDFIRGAIAYSLKSRAKRTKAKGGASTTGSNKTWIDNYYKEYLENESAEEKFNNFYDKYEKVKGGGV